MQEAPSWLSLARHLHGKLSLSAIARRCGVWPQTVRYWLDPEWRAKRQASARKRNALHYAKRKANRPPSYRGITTEERREWRRLLQKTRLEAKARGIPVERLRESWKVYDLKPRGIRPIYGSRKKEPCHENLPSSRERLPEQARPLRHGTGSSF